MSSSFPLTGLHRPEADQAEQRVVWKSDLLQENEARFPVRR